MGKYLKILKESALFSTLTENQLERIDAISEERVYQQGEMIFEQDAPESELFIIIDGSVEIFYNLSPVFSKTSTQDIQPVLTLSKGQSFGEVSLVDDGLRTAGARAKEDGTRVLMIWRRKLLLLCNSYHDFGYQVMYNLAADLAHRFRRVDASWRESLIYGK